MVDKKHATGSRSFPGFDTAPQMSDEAYSGDKPNPSLPHFIAQHSVKFDADSDTYNIGGFSEPITTTKATAIYNMHTYWSKKPHDAIQRYMRHFTTPGDVVLDPFCGSGGTVLAALIQGCSGIAVDRSPAATFLTRNHCYPSGSLSDAFEQVASAVKKEIDWLYATKCERCGGTATTTATICSQVFQCPRCLQKVPLYDCVSVEAKTAKGKPKRANACPHCYSTGQTELIKSQSEKFGSIPVKVKYKCLNGCKPNRGERTHNDGDAERRKAFLEFDLGKLAEIEGKDIPHPYPKGYEMTSFSRYQRDALFYYDVTEVADLYTKRNLWAMSAIVDAISNLDDSVSRDAMMFVVTSMCLFVTRMHQDNSGTGGNITKGTYYLPQNFKDMQVWDSFKRKFKSVERGFEQLRGLVPENPQAVISTQSACNLSAISDNSIDYIFTDPPYAEKVQYGELNYVWEAWLDVESDWHEEEIIVNEVRGISEADWANSIKQSMAECFRVLKPGRWLSLCYHDTSEGSWHLIQDIMTEVGFLIDKTDAAVFIDTGQKSYNQLRADKTTKRDLVLNFRKPKPGDSVVTHLYIPSDVDAETFHDLGRQFIRDFLTTHPGSTKDRVYDELVNRMVRRGEMEAHDFEELLRSVAEEVSEPIKRNLIEDGEADLLGSHVTSRWYLKETADQIDRAEQDKEDSAAARLEKFMVHYQESHPEKDGIHYSDVFEQVIVIPVEDRPRRLCEHWLPEYFFKTTQGTWRPPEDEVERQQKAAMREAGTLRRMKRFANALIEGVPVREQDRPDGVLTLLEWIRQCRRAGLYEQGRALYEKGGLDLTKLDDEEQIEVEDDYRICVKRGSEDKPKKRSKGRKKKN